MNNDEGIMMKESGRSGVPQLLIHHYSFIITLLFAYENETTLCFVRTGAVADLSPPDSPDAPLQQVV
jgi:hypothetical protein